LKKLIKTASNTREATVKAHKQIIVSAEEAIEEKLNSTVPVTPGVGLEKNL
jgi:ElaB/YqjD/DUF883 family membrane-anchored ribosome-binding protein